MIREFFSKRTIYLLGILSGLFFSSGVWAQTQDTLPKFSVRNIGNNHIIIGWVNNYQTVNQISVQRSFDSLGVYKTVLSVADPMAKDNGIADSKAPNNHMFYRLFVVLDGGSYFFTPAKKPVFDTVTRTEVKDVVAVQPLKTTDSTTAAKVEPVVKKPEFVPSYYVYTNRDGYVFINLPDAEKKKYQIKFYDEDGSLLFELKNIKEKALTLDKSNFYHAGWFNFELYNDGKLVEKNKFYLNRLF